MFQRSGAGRHHRPAPANARHAATGGSVRPSAMRRWLRDDARPFPWAGRPRCLDRYSGRRPARNRTQRGPEGVKIAHPRRRYRDSGPQYALSMGTVPGQLLRVNYGMQRHGGGGMAVRAMCCLPAVIGAWRHVGGEAMLSTSNRTLGYQCPGAARPGPAGDTHHQHGATRGGGSRESSGPPVNALRLQLGPAAVARIRSRADGLKRICSRSFTSGSTDTVDYADIICRRRGWSIRHPQQHGHLR